ncbi:pyroglutamyl-peptidase [Anaerosphaera aminiphila DSM 21120]|uniref:Pyrrolidone-carboxylate peptidase n=1 Tax=Anaerosphaera aminiphila DSM 21120 TaxID=1120995 RepID=A0A1M5PTD1_9FIRM|nr:pyroglutamyl-peptidase I [Anaerosphaera aminiphila]SHH04962.1 pyroglutamyl-peptidase [Anaerosphaera aminiphila DSM 21120]
MNLLITGFEPFDSETVNSGYEAIKLLPDKILDYNIIKLELPVIFEDSIDILIKAIENFNPSIVLCIGQAGGQANIIPERVAINIDDARIPDNKGMQPVDVPIFKDGENAYFSKLPIKKIVENLKSENIPADISNSAGTYVCNHIMYGLLYFINKNKEYNSIIGGFIHVPYLETQVVNKPNTPSMTTEEICRALKISIETIIKEPVKNIDTKKKSYFFDFSV